jgi:hypothetical protein
MPTPKFIAYGQQGIRLASTDGRTWSEPVLEKEKYYFRNCEYAREQYVAFATLGSKVGIFSSTDGLGWQRLAEQDVRDNGGRLHDICYGNERFLIIGGDMDGRWTSVMTSPDARQWTGPEKFDKQPVLTRVVFGNKQFVAVGYQGRVATSVAGKSWTDAQPLAELDTFIDIAYGNGTYVGSGLHGLRMHSTDGLMWSGRVVGEEGEHINSMLFTGKQFVGVGLGATFFSTNGIQWRRVPNENAPVAAAYGNGVFVGTKWRGRLLHSTDGVKWEETIRTPEHVTGVFHG